MLLRPDDESELKVFKTFCVVDLTATEMEVISAKYWINVESFDSFNKAAWKSSEEPAGNKWHKDANKRKIKVYF